MPNSPKFAACVVFSSAVAMGSTIGETYQQVLAEKGSPKSQIQAGSMRVLSYPDSVLKLRDNVVISIRPVVAAPQATPAVAPTAATPPSPQAQIESQKRQLDAAVARVEEIINQEVPSQPKPRNLSLWEFHFHDGATRPDFNAVDVRTTRQTSEYDAHDFITWKDRPELMWAGKDLEFNPMTKFFYMDRSLPKKRLTEEEMVEVNRLYRVIGQCEQQLGQLSYTGAVP